MWLAVILGVGLVMAVAVGLDADEAITIVLVLGAQAPAVVATAVWFGAHAPHRGWHPAKLVLLWGGVLVVVFAGQAVADGELVGVLVLGGGAAIALAFVLTWTWLSARESGPVPPVPPLLEPSPASDSLPDSSQPKKTSAVSVASHVRGWLLAFVLWTLLAMVAAVRGCAATIPITGASDITPAYFPAIQDEALNLAWLIAAAVGLYRVVRRRPGTRRYWIITLLVFAPTELYRLLLVYQIALNSGRDLPDAARQSAIGLALFRTLVALGWWLYWVFSGRVRIAFAAPTGASNPEVRTASEMPPG
jgi:hypothetical protein